MSTQATGDTTSTAQTTVERCGQCGAPAAHEQRYCLNCGFHRRNAPDPVARYLSDASVALSRVAAATALAAQRRRRLRFGPKVTATLVAVALLVGILIGNATGGGTVTPKASTATGKAKSTTTAKKSPVKNSTGSSYLQQENNLPNSVTP
jgi:ribosomal protein L37E